MVLLKSNSLCRSKVIKLKNSLGNFHARPGVLFAISSCFFFATSSVLVHVVNEIHAIQTVFYRSLFQLLFTIPMLIYAKVNPLPQNHQHTVILLLRGVAGSTALCFQFYAFQHMAVSDATVIIFSSPIFTGILAYCILGERWSKMDGLATFLCFLGVLLIARPANFFTASFKTKEHFFYSLVAFAGAILTSFSIIALKKVSGSVHYLVPSFYLSLVGTLETGLLSLYPGVLKQLICGHQILVLLIGLCAICGQCLLAKAVQMEKASTVALVRTFDIVLAFTFQIIFFDHNPNFYSIFGAILVSLCNVVIILSGGTKSEEEDKKNGIDLELKSKNSEQGGK